jgi:branched-chain amino acid transport system permease protein
VEYFLQQLINGVTLGMVYGLIAIGYTMVYGIIGMINFAHGEIYMVSAFIALIVFVLLGVTSGLWLPFVLVIVLLTSMIFAAAYGWAVERVAYRPLRSSTRLAPLISAIGMSIFLQNYVQLLHGARNKPIQPIISGGVTITESPAGFVVHLSYVQMLIIVSTIIVMAIFTVVIRRTSLGRAQRACQQDRSMAALVGVNVDRTISLTFVIGASLAAMAGLMALMYYGIVHFFMGFLVGIKAFTAAVLGGIGSVPGAMLGGLLLGLIEVFFSGYFSLDYKDLAAFAILVLVLIFRPTGLMGEPEIEKV